MQVNRLEAKTQLSKPVEADSPVKRKWGVWAGLMTDEEIDHAFSPEVDAELARESVESADRPFEAGVRKPSASTKKAASTRRVRKGNATCSTHMWSCGR